MRNLSRVVFYNGTAGLEEVKKWEGKKKKKKKDTEDFTLRLMLGQFHIKNWTVEK